MMSQVIAGSEGRGSARANTGGSGAKVKFFLSKPGTEYDSTKTG